MAPLLLAAVMFSSIVLINKILNSLTIHSRFMRCKHRTNTTHQIRLEKLKQYWFLGVNGSSVWFKEDVVTFDFGESEESYLIELPSGSMWRTCEHTHLTQEMCLNIDTLAGQWFIGSAHWGHPSPAPPEYMGQFGAFGRMRPSQGVAVARITCSRKARQLEHVLASAVQDSKLYFRLCSTPVWIRLLYVVVENFPSAKDWLVQRILWIQLRTIFFKNDVWQHRGTFNIWRWTYWLTEPRWVTRWNRWLRLRISRERTRMSYFLGKYMLGMDSWYSEYEIARLSEIKEMDVKMRCD